MASDDEREALLRDLRMMLADLRLCACNKGGLMTDDIKALVAKLREKPSYWHQPTYEFLHRDAADAIEALEAENESLRIDNLGHVLGHTDAMLRTRLERAEQERDAYAAVIHEAVVQLNAASIPPVMSEVEWMRRREWDLRATLTSKPADEVVAARDRRVAAEALRSASSLTTDDDYVFRSTDDVRDWLRARADQIENGSADG